MKKPAKNYRLRQARIIAKRYRRTHKKTARKHRPVSRRKAQANILKRELLAAPENLAFFQDTAETTIQFINQLGKAADGGRNVLIDFSNTRYMTAAGAVYLYSEIDRLQTHNAASIRVDLRSATGWIRVYLRESGIFKLTNRHPQPTGRGLTIITGNNDVPIQMIALEVINYLFAEADFFPTSTVWCLICLKTPDKSTGAPERAVVVPS